MDALLRQEEVVFTTTAGGFDVEAIAEAVAGIGYSFRDEADPSRFVMASDEQSRDTFQKRRRDDPGSRFPYVPLLRVTPEEVVLSPMSDPEAVRDLCIALIEWLTTHYECKASDPFGNEVAEQPVNEPRTAARP